MKLRSAARDIATPILSILRHSGRTILWPNERLGGGNLLYLLLAVAGSSGGNEQRLLKTTVGEQWLDWFPALCRLCIDRSDVKFTDRRVIPGPLQAYGLDFSSHMLNTFIDNYLMTPGSDFVRMVDAHRNDYDVTINVRRGDYYSDPRWRGEYSFDVVEYVRSVIPSVDAHAPIISIHIVSDDIEWCRTKLGWLRGVAPVSFRSPTASPQEQLAQIAASPRLVLTNSTFSYWGGYLSEYIHSMEQAGAAPIWAPRFHNRYFADGGRATQLSPGWRIVETIPGGWNG